MAKIKWTIWKETDEAGVDRFTLRDPRGASVYFSREKLLNKNKPLKLKAWRGILQKIRKGIPPHVFILCDLAMNLEILQNYLVELEDSSDD